MIDVENVLVVHKPIESKSDAFIVQDVVSAFESCGFDVVSKDVLKTGNLLAHQDLDETIPPTLIVSLGGDGTMLNAMREALLYKNHYVLGINIGHLGFLAEDFKNTVDNYQEVFANLSDFFKVEQRSVLHGSVKTKNGFAVDFGDYVGINEFLISGENVNSFLYTDVLIDNQHAMRLQGGGVLVSSATGSTAMSLSAGGAIVSPDTNVMQIVPIVAHNLTSRPVITSGRNTITIKAVDVKNYSQTNRVVISTDGWSLLSLDIDYFESFTVKQHSTRINILRPKNWNFFDVLSKKMKW